MYDKDHKQVAFISSKDVLWDWGIHACTNNPKEEGKCDQGEEIAEAVHHWWQFMYSTRTITISNVGAYKALVTADEVWHCMLLTPCGMFMHKELFIHHAR